MKKRFFYFNLIEIVLTVAVISFGVVVILGMLPKGLRASRNAATVSYASEVMEQMGHYIQRQGSSSLPENNFADVADDKDIIDNYTKLLTDSSVTGFTKFGIDGIYQFTKSSSTKGVYIIVIGNNEEIDGEKVRNVLFSGMLRVAYRKDTPNYTVCADHSKHGDEDGCYGDDPPCGSEEDNFSVKKANDIKTVYMELSYPLSVDYESRSKSYYSFDVL